MSFIEIWCRPRKGEASAMAVYAGGDNFAIFREGGYVECINGEQLQRRFTLVNGDIVPKDLRKVTDKERVYIVDKYPEEVKAFFVMATEKWVANGVQMGTEEFRRLFSIEKKKRTRVIMPNIDIERDNFTLLLFYFDNERVSSAHINRCSVTWHIVKDGIEINMISGGTVKDVLKNYMDINKDDHISGVLHFKGVDYEI